MDYGDHLGIANAKPEHKHCRLKKTLVGFGLDIGDGVSKMSPLSIILRRRDVIIILAINNRSRRR